MPKRNELAKRAHSLYYIINLYYIIFFFYLMCNKASLVIPRSLAPIVLAKSFTGVQGIATH